LFFESLDVAPPSGSVRISLSLGLQADLSRRQQRHALRFRPRKTPIHEIPTGDFALRVHTGPHGDQLSRTFGLPTVLVLTHPLHAYRLSHGARQQGRILRRIVCAQPSIATGTFAVDDV